MASKRGVTAALLIGNGQRERGEMFKLELLYPLKYK